VICVVVLQNCMGFVEGETGSCSETCLMCDVDGNEEVSIKVEEAIDIKEEVSIKVEEAVDIKDEIPEALTFPPIKTEQEVRLWGVCVRWWHLMLLGHLLPQKGNCEITLKYLLLCIMFWVPYSFKIWIVILKGRDILDVIAINGRII